MFHVKHRTASNIFFNMFHVKHSNKGLPNESSTIS